VTPLVSVSCPAPGSCTAVGTYYTEEFGYLPLAEHLTPLWSVQGASELAEKTKVPPLANISCASSSSCMAVGSASNGSVELGYATFWNGTKWVEWGSSSRGSFKGVSCPSTSFCTAVGGATGGGTFSETWNGSSWSVAATPNPSGENAQLKDVSCTSSTACTAVGSYYTTANGYVPLAERWNGTQWSLQSPALPAEGRTTEFSDVSCSSATDCIAVGTTPLKVGEGPYYEATPFAEHWDGTSWSITTTVNPSTPSDQLYKVSCSAANSCVALGGSEGSQFAEYWDGSKWSLTSSLATPSGAVGPISMGDVTCSSSTSCVAVGTYATEKKFSVIVAKSSTLAETWNGKEWTIQSSPNSTGNNINALEGVSCSSSVACIAVGSAKKAYNEGETVPLGESYR